MPETNLLPDDFFREVFVNSPQPIWIYDLVDLRFVSVNDAACNRYGYTRQEFLSLTLRDIRPEEDIAPFDAYVKNKKMGIPCPERIWRHCTKTGEIIFVDAVTNYIKFNDRELVSVVLHDVTSEHIVAAQRDALLNHFQDIILARSFTKELLWVNSAFERILGWTLEDLRSIDLLTLVHPEDRQISVNAYDELGGKGIAVTWETRWLCKSGEYVWLHWSGKPDPTSEVIYLVGQEITSSKAGLNRLEQSERNLADAQELAHIGSWSYEISTGNFRLSDEYYRITGHEPGGFEPTWENCIRCVHPEDRSIVESSRLIESPPTQSHDINVRLVRPSGDIRFVRSRTRAIMESNQCIRFEGTIQDVTNDKAHEEELGKVLSCVRCLLWQAKAWFGASGWEWTFEVRNTSDAKRIFDFDVPPGGSYSDAFMTAKLPEDARRLWALPKEGVLPLDRSGYNQEFRVKLADGTVRWLNEDVTIDSAGGGIWLFTGICVDITEAKAVSDALEESEKHLSQAQAIAHVGSWSYDVLTSSTTLSDEFFRIVGYEPNGFEPTWYSIIQSVHPEDRHLIEQRGLDTGVWSDDLEEIEVRIRRPNDEIRTVLASTVAILDEGGKPKRLDGVITDITERKLAETGLVEAEQSLRMANESLERRIRTRTLELELSMKEAERANNAKSEFLSRMSHELRTPLNAILGFGQVLGFDDLTDLQQESVEHILKGGRHLLNLINEILEVSKIESGNIVCSLEPVDVEQLVGESFLLLRPIAENAKISLVIAEHLPPNIFVLADIQRFKQVLINLLSNAIKYNKEHGFVEVSWECNERIVRISVSDTGRGMSPTDLERLFTPFERLGISSTEIEGTGLGLVLSKRLVEVMGGQIQVVSNLGVGSTFTVELAKAANAVQHTIDSVAELPILPRGNGLLGRYFVLVIEDNISNLKLMEAILEKRGDIELISSIQGRVGIDLAINSKPDLILVDLNLPDMHGSEVVRELIMNESTAGIPIVVVSADATSAQIEKLLKSGASHYLTKPVDVVQFLETIESFLPVKE